MRTQSEGICVCKLREVSKIFDYFVKTIKLNIEAKSFEGFQVLASADTASPMLLQLLSAAAYFNLITLVSLIA